MKVCVYAICKNESQFVDRFMDSMSEADYVCVLDTGSSDDTVKKLRARGATVGETVVSPWRFDTARNESLGLIPADADICCAIDLDEQFHPGWRAALERAWQPDTTRARYRYTWSFRPDGSEGMVFWADKIHKNGCYRWASPVHETLSYTGEGAERFVDAAGVQLDHHPDETKSRGQYLPLLELAVREDPQNDRNCHYLGREYMFRGEWQKAIETLARHLTLPSAVWADERCASMRYIARCLRALEQDTEAERWLHRAVAEAPHLREPYMDYAQLLYTQERWYGLVDVLCAALAITERPRTYICEADAWGSLPYDLLSLAYAHLGDAENAADACRKLGYEPVVLTDRLCCEAREAGSFLGSIVRTHAGQGKRLAFIAGGETVVHLTGKGLGGRNQELALAAAPALAGLEHCCVFSVGSDGTDGPTDAAGGYVDGDTAAALAAAGWNVFDALQNNDAYHALQAVEGLILTGATGTNVNDVAVALV